jgi:hypothetical protein
MRARAVAAFAVALAMVAGAAPATVGAAEDPATIGRFTSTFVEPTISGTKTDEKCIEAEGETRGAEGDIQDCKPAAGAMSQLPNGNILYWNALEGTENVQNGIAMEFGRAAVNDQARVLDLNLRKPSKSKWRTPSPDDGGAVNEGGNYLLPEQLVNDPDYNDGSMFCTDLVFLANGKVLIIGGTDYYAEPAAGDSGYGVVELEGTKSARIFDPKSETFTQSGDMNWGRWYPSMVTQGNGKIFVASGVTKLMKPVYGDRSPADSGTNVHQTETYNPRTGKWTENGDSAKRSLPLYPRLHLLPNGDIFYAANGQVYNPNGQSYDEALWNIAASYDPKTKTWTDLGIPGLGVSATPGFRGSSFSAMLRMKPDAKGNYDVVEFLQAGGVAGTTPGAYIAIDDSRILRVDASSDTPSMEVESTERLNQARWYGSGITLPDGKVFTVNGADRDEVVGPGTGFPVTTSELFDPETKSWTLVAEQNNPRTYHNSALLLPDARVLVGGHAPISAGYGANGTFPGGFSPNEGRDPTFEIYEPPYLHYGVARPAIADAPSRLRRGKTFKVVVNGPAKRMSSVVLARNTSTTHIIDGDQRMVELPVLKRKGRTLTVKAPANANVLPAGPYMLFVNKRSAKGEVPSVSKQLFVR